MKEYAKFIDENQIEYPPVYKDGISNYHLAEDKLKADGYLELADLAYPNDNKNYQAKYRLHDNQIEQYWLEIVEPEKSYSELRALEYPPIAEYLDAQVKINSGNETLIKEGQAQEQAYFSKCLAVKAKYPKPTINPTEAENA